MKHLKFKSSLIAAILMSIAAIPAQANIIISEVNANGSAASSGYSADWFELTNTGSTAVNIAGWKMDDNSNAFASAVGLRGLTSIDAGQSVIFLEGAATSTNDAALNAAFKSAWFGANVPANLIIANYGGSGVGLSGTADAVNIFDAAGTLITRVDFGASVLGQTFDNSIGLNNVTISTLSTVGVNSAIKSSNLAEIGSPGNVAPVPEPESYAMLLAGFGLLGFMVRRRKS